MHIASCIFKAYWVSLLPNSPPKSFYDDPPSGLLVVILPPSFQHDRSLVVLPSIALIIPLRLINKFHSWLVTCNIRNRWLIVATSCLHMWHLEQIDMPLFLRLSAVRTTYLTTNQVKHVTVYSIVISKSSNSSPCQDITPIYHTIHLLFVCSLMLYVGVLELVSSVVYMFPSCINATVSKKQCTFSSGSTQPLSIKQSWMNSSSPSPPSCTPPYLNYAKIF